MPRLQPRSFAWPEERRVDGAIRCRQLQPNHRLAHLWDRRLFSAEDANSPWTFSDLVEPSPNRVDLWRSHCHRQAHPSRNPFRPMCCPVVRAVILRPLEPEEELTCWSEDPAPHSWLRAIRAEARERLLSYSELTSRDPWTTCRENPVQTLSTLPHRFAFYPSAPVRQAVLRISSWLAPSFWPPFDLAIDRWRRRAMRRTDFCHPYNYVHPHLARSRLASLVTQRGRPTETKAPYDTIGGPSVSRHSKTASADRRCVLTSSSNPSRAGDTSVGVFFPRHSGDRASDTPVAILVHPRASPSFPGAASSPYVRVFTGWYGSEGAKTAETIDCACSWKPTPRPDPGCLPSWGTLRRIRWPLRPRSRDRHTTFRAMGRPLNGTLAPLWVSSGPVPFTSGKRPEHRRSFRSPHPSMVSPTAVHFELGPRSLDPAAVFAARMPSLFETRRRLTTSATAYDVRATKPYDSRDLAGTMASTIFLFWLNTPSPLRERCWAASRATFASKTPVLVRPACASLPSRDTSKSAPPPPVLPGRCIARINVHGSKDRVKDASRGACDDVSCLRPVPTLEVA